MAGDICARRRNSVARGKQHDGFTADYCTKKILGALGGCEFCLLKTTKERNLSSQYWQVVNKLTCATRSISTIAAWWRQTSAYRRHLSSSVAKLVPNVRFSSLFDVRSGRCVINLQKFEFYPSMPGRGSWRAVGDSQVVCNIISYCFAWLANSLKCVGRVALAPRHGDSRAKDSGLEL